MMAKKLWEDGKSGEETLPTKLQETAVAKSDFRSEFESTFRPEDNLAAVENVVLPWIKVSKEAKAFVLGDDIQKEFYGYVLAAERQNAFWKGKYRAGENAVPDCFSRGPQGAMVPDPSIEEPVHHRCGNAKDPDGCPMNKFGTATDLQGNPASGKACKNTTVLMILVDDGEMQNAPYLLRLTPTSIKSWDRFASAAAHQGLRYPAIRTKFSVSIAKNDYGTAQVDLSKDRVLSFDSEDDVQVLKQILGKTRQYKADFRDEAGNITREEMEGTGDPF